MQAKPGEYKALIGRVSGKNEQGRPEAAFPREAGPRLASGSLHFGRVPSLPDQRGSLYLDCLYKLWLLLTAYGLQRFWDWGARQKVPRGPAPDKHAGFPYRQHFSCVVTA